jgi:LacI family transcriptional regulator
MQEKLTIQDIARLAGVSKATVSRVLNRNPSVNAELSERVMRIVKEHNFIPNATATGLAGGRMHLIGVLAPPLTWPSVPAILGGVAKYIEDTSYEIVLYSISNERNHSDVLDHILALRMVSGLLAISPGALSEHLTARFQQGLPMAMIEDQEKPGSVPWVGINNIESAYKATTHLLQLGHRRIAHIAGPQTYYCATERLQGYYQALQDAGITPDPELLLQGNFETSSGQQCATTLFARARSLWPDAIFVGNDQMAYGVLEVAEQQGIHIPEDIAIVGFDDNIFSAHKRPPLTTIRQPFAEMGYTACEILLTMIDPDHRAHRQRLADYPQQASNSPSEHLALEHPIRIQLATSLVMRASSGAIRSLSQPLSAQP